MASKPVHAAPLFQKNASRPVHASSLQSPKAVWRHGRNMLLRVHHVLEDGLVLVPGMHHIFYVASKNSAECFTLLVKLLGSGFPAELLLGIVPSMQASSWYVKTCWKCEFPCSYESGCQQIHRPGTYIINYRLDVVFCVCKFKSYRTALGMHGACTCTY